LPSDVRSDARREPVRAVPGRTAGGGAGPFVLAGAGAARWDTFPGERTLVVAARTLTSAVRVLECLPSLLRGDPRVIVLFAHDPGSAFGDGVPDLLRDNGCRVVPWDRLPDVRADLVLTASENVDLPDADCPVLVLPHGVGFHKYVPDSRGPGRRLSGMVPDRLLESGRAWLAVSHPDQEAQLAAAHPRTAGRTLPIGDPCYDELLVSLPRSAAYRQALGVTGGRRLVVVSSTWGPTALLGRDAALPGRLLARLPVDEYAVAAVVHPNVWAAHGSWRLRTVLAPALEAGLLLVPPVHRWRQALVAADAVVGDHGSVTLYGAALGKPVLLAAFGEESVPGTAAERLARTTRRLDPHGDIHRQIADAIERPPAGVPPLARAAFAEPGQALGRLREALYRLLELPEPRTAAPVPPALAPDAVDAADPTAWTVTTTAPARGVVTVVRHPAAVSEGADEPAGAFRHLAADVEERDRRLLESASVLVRRAPHASRTGALGWARATLAAYPGARVAATGLPGGHLVALRDGRTVEATVTGPARDPAVTAAVVYTCLRAGRPLDTTVTLRLGTLPEQDVSLRPTPAA
jgi:hypothetical protein